MPKKSGDTVFKLVSSLTKSEKRYFRIFAQRHSNENKYLHLFDILVKNGEYNEEYIQKQLAIEQKKGPTNVEPSNIKIHYLVAAARRRFTSSQLITFHQAVM